MDPHRPEFNPNVRIKAEVSEEEHNQSAKCGNIFITSSRQYTFVCEFCRESFEDMVTFGVHLDVKHFGNQYVNLPELPRVEMVTTNGFTVANANGEPEFTVYYLDEPSEAEPLIESTDKMQSGQVHGKLEACRQSQRKDCPQRIENDNTLLIPLERTVFTYNNRPSTDQNQQHNRTLPKSLTARQRDVEDRGFAVKVEPSDCTLSDTMDQTASLVELENFHAIFTPDIEYTEPVDEPELSPFDDDNWYCFSCDRQFKAKYTFTKHKKWHNSTEDKTKNTHEPAHCDLCNRTYKSVHSIRSHAIRIHGNRVPKSLENDPVYFSCEFCHLKFDKPLERHKHERSHKEEFPYTCQICSKSFKLKHYRTAHMSTVHFKRRMRGSLEWPDYDDIMHASSTSTYPSEPVESSGFAVDEPLLISDTREFRKSNSKDNGSDCGGSEEFDCTKNFIDRESLKMHIHENGKPQSYDASTSIGFLCDLCGHWVKTIKFLKNHALQRHGNVIPKLLEHDPTYRKCNFCHVKFEKATDRVKHERTHREEVPFCCPFCSLSFKSQRKRYRHIHSYHRNMRPYTCPHCFQSFTKYLTYVHHVKNHLGVIQVKCQYCQKQFDNAEYEDHIRTQHLDQWPFECEICGERFRHKPRLVYHQGKHENGLQFECDVCGKAFYMKNHLKAHRVCHSTDRPFVCSQCSATFKTKDSLFQHTKIHKTI